jgi:hypothetical protein
MQKLTKLYVDYKGEEPVNIEKLPGAGSNRQYYRFVDKDGGTIIGVIGTSRDENHAFVYMDNHFSMRKLPVPKVLAVSDDELALFAD